MRAAGGSPARSLPNMGFCDFLIFALASVIPAFPLRHSRESGNPEGWGRRSRAPAVSHQWFYGVGGALGARASRPQRRLARGDTLILAFP